MRNHSYIEDNTDGEATSTRHLAGWFGKMSVQKGGVKKGRYAHFVVINKDTEATTMPYAGDMP